MEDPVLPKAVISGEGSLGFPVQCKGYLPVALCQIQSGDETSLSQSVNVIIYT